MKLSFFAGVADEACFDWTLWPSTQTSRSMDFLEAGLRFMINCLHHKHVFVASLHPMHTCCTYHVGVVALILW